MADDHERQSDDADGESDGDGAAPSPGGGPKRVVSETSVDDILSSVQGDADDSSPDRVATEVSPADDGRDGERDADESDVSDARQEESTDDEDETADEDEITDEDEAEDETGAGTEPDGDLAERVEHGTVTGADVRAAEAGEGRDPTPEIDDVDLSLDDLDSSPVGDADPTDSTGDDGADERSGESDSGGFLARLKGLFS